MLRTAHPPLNHERPPAPWAGGNPAALRVRGMRGFSLIELMIVVAIVGILVAIALPNYQVLTVRARVAEGFSLMSGVRPAIVSFYAGRGELPGGLVDLGLQGDGSAPPVYSGTVTDRAAFSVVYGFTSDLWSHVEWQVKTTDCPATDRCGALVLRSIGSALTNNVDLGLHLLVHATPTGGVRFRCVVNNNVNRMRFVPANCRVGSADEFSGW